METKTINVYDIVNNSPFDIASPCQLCSINQDLRDKCYTDCKSYITYYAIKARYDGTVIRKEIEKYIKKDVIVELDFGHVQKLSSYLIRAALREPAAVYTEEFTLKVIMVNVTEHDKCYTRLIKMLMSPITSAERKWTEKDTTRVRVMEGFSYMPPMKQPKGE